MNAAVIDDAGRVLLTRREDFEVWCLPGGAPEPGESLAAAAVREVAEETGLVVRLTRLVGIYSRPLLGGYHSAVLFAAARDSGTLRPDPTEVVEADWFAANEVPADLLWGQRERILDALDGLGGSIVRTTDRTRPAIWPRDRKEWYDQRDRSGMSRSAFYGQLLDALGDDASHIEVDGAPAHGAAPAMRRSR